MTWNAERKVWSELLEQVHALLKRLLSYRKGTWTVGDYPVRLEQQDVATLQQSGRFRPITWTAQIVNWWQMAGHGDTKEEALADLRVNLKRFRGTHDTLPRPGTVRPLEFASSALIGRHEDLARDFFARVLGVDYDECFVSDESSLGSHVEETNDEFYRKIADLYGVGVSDIEGGRLGLILERIASRQNAG